MPDPEEGDEARRELAELRRRAYGRDADIRSDPLALARLDALEEEQRRAWERNSAAAARPAPGGTASRAGEDAATPGAADAAAPRALEDARAEPSGRVRSRPSRWHIGFIAGVGVVAALLGAAAAGAALSPQAHPLASTDPAQIAAAEERVAGFTGNSTTRVLFRIPVDGLFGRYVQLPNYASAPEFPTESPLEWVQPLGTYYSSAVWLARPESGDSCLLVVVEGRDHAACVPPVVFDRSVLLILVPYAELDPANRPPSMTENQSLGFWWRPDRPVDVLVGPSGGGSADD
jgi:hypothetical protein